MIYAMPPKIGWKWIDIIYYFYDKVLMKGG
jgi:hypothetical protein